MDINMIPLGKHPSNTSLSIEPRSSSKETQSSRLSPAGIPESKLSSQTLNSAACNSVNSRRLLRLAHEQSPDSRRENSTARTIEKLEGSWKESPDHFYLKRIVHSTNFSCVVFIVIVANAIQLGIETDLGDKVDWKPVEYAFLILYAIELALRFAADRWECLFNPQLKRWFLFDLVVVVIGVLDALSLGGLLPGSSSVVILRIVRLVKLVRILRLFQFCNELCLLISSMTSALKTVTWMWILIAILIYMFAILFCNELGHQYPNDADMQSWWGTVARSSFTLFTILTLENWVEIARHAWSIAPAMLVMMIIFITITTYAIMNVVGAIIVQRVVEEALQKQESQMKRAERELHNIAVSLITMFEKSDTDKDGSLSREEFHNALEDKKFRNQLRMMDIEDENLAGLFDEIDLNRNGILSVEEFVQGTIQMRGNARARRLFELHSDVSRNQRKTEQSMANLALVVSQGFENIHEWMKQHQASESASRASGLQEKQFVMSSDNSVESRSMVTEIHSLQQSIEKLREPRVPSAEWLPPTEKEYSVTRCATKMQDLPPSLEKVEPTVEESREPNRAPQVNCTPFLQTNSRESPATEHTSERNSPEQSFHDLRATISTRFHDLHQSVEELMQHARGSMNQMLQVPTVSPSKLLIAPIEVDEAVKELAMQRHHISLKRETDNDIYTNTREMFLCASCMRNSAWKAPDVGTLSGQNAAKEEAMMQSHEKRNDLQMLVKEVQAATSKPSQTMQNLLSERSHGTTMSL